MAAPGHTWYVVVNSERQALGIYGASLGEMARKHEAEMRAAYPFTSFDTVTVMGSIKPRIGSRV